jgi:pimeloyl-ACP methyl ester carboxylesterase
MNLSTPLEKPRSSKRTAVLTLSAAAAATALWVEVQARRAERDNPPAGKFVYIDGVRLHYVVRGEGPPVVLLHGNTVTLADFHASGLIDQLARNHRVIVFDRPGFGHSTRPRDRLWTPSAQAELFHSALTVMGVKRPVVVGHSIGTLVALAMALNQPAMVDSLVLIGGYYYPSIRLDALLTAPVALPVLGDVLRYTVTALTGRAVLNRMVQGMFAPAEVPPCFFSMLSREMMLRPVQLRANAEEAAFMMPQARALARRYHELRLPVTLIAGGADKVVDFEAHSRRLHSEVPQSQLHIVPHGGHMAHYLAQDLIESAVDRPSPALRSDVQRAAMPSGTPSQAQSQTAPQFEPPKETEPSR